MRILSGIQPSGKLHLGNYFGMMRPALELAQQGEAFYFIADYHALTSVTDAAQLRENALDVALDFLACGLDPKRTVFYRQSDLPQVTELAWILACVTPMPMLENAVSYKDKIAQGLKPNVGLFTYPVLQAADILIVQGARVPVGRDQKQHIEITRDIAGTFNRLFGETFVLPEAVIRPDTAVLPGTDGRKMSKSYGNTIEIFGEEKATRKKIMSIVTDSQPVEAPKTNLDQNIPLQLLRALDPALAREQEMKLAAGGYGYGALKTVLADALLAHFAPMRARRAELQRNLDYVQQVLREGAERARVVADQTMRRVREVVGLR
ncbi:MAG: tryptophan--tRNA ligase [Verrucomicrobiae bacterium]|nr:tryptophan--tRNA ligase [Verrucomicrobiae bacterium]MDW8343021.1 tryptophan--tRNA ligase [Verrucomicrobiae bacterium]